MPYRYYNKEYKSPEELVLYMQTKGLSVASEYEAKRFIENVNYYRFKAYLWPFLDENLAFYLSPSSFEQGVELYRFDEELRNYIFSIICRIEIKLRSKLDQVVASHTNNPFWYLDNTLFLKNTHRAIDGVRTNLSANFLRSKDDFSNHFKNNYYNDTNSDFKQLPPFWVISELATFGQIPIIYNSLDKAQFQGVKNSNKLDALANEFGARNLKELNNWIIAIRDVRNRCAHHSRVWNANHRQASGVLNRLHSSYPPTNPNKIYLFCILLKRMDDHLSMRFQVKYHLLSLFDKYPESKARAHSAGFPVDWYDDPIWS
jgi:abortive infection bacteriophage resistance protein